ncbi:MAG: class I SAM-dependent methyltransferase [Raineya sp.]
MKQVIEQLNEFYKEQIQIYGSTPQGVNWKDAQAQEVRFSQLLKIIDAKEDFSINDLGCGYGALVEFMKKNSYVNFQFRGYDLSEEMILQAQKTYDYPEARFYHIQQAQEMQNADYCVASGIFNKKLQLKEFEFLPYILETLEVMNEKSHRGFAFNMLTSYSDKDKQREDLYYASPTFIFDYCMRNFSKNVALLHDYKAYDFTILVRK